jgi:hypothetical protein
VGERHDLDLGAVVEERAEPEDHQGVVVDHDDGNG